MPMILDSPIRDSYGIRWDSLFVADDQIDTIVQTITKFKCMENIGTKTERITDRPLAHAILRLRLTTKFDARVENFSTPGKSQSFPKGSNPFFRIQRRSGFANSESRYLHAGFNSFDRLHNKNIMSRNPKTKERFVQIQ